MHSWLCDYTRNNKVKSLQQFMRHTHMKKDKRPWHETVSNIRPVAFFMTFTDFLISCTSSEAIKWAEKGSMTCRQIPHQASQSLLHYFHLLPGKQRLLIASHRWARKWLIKPPILICQLPKREKQQLWWRSRGEKMKGKKWQASSFNFSGLRQQRQQPLKPFTGRRDKTSQRPSTCS